MTEPTSGDEGDEAPRSPALRHGYVLGIALVFTVTGAIVAPTLFPDVSGLRAALGGVIFGGVCTLAAAMHRIF